MITRSSYTETCLCSQNLQKRFAAAWRKKHGAAPHYGFRIASKYIFIALIFASMNVGCSPSRNLTVALRQNENQHVFEITCSGFNGLLGMHVWQVGSKDMLWDVNLNYYQGNQIIYGRVPVGIKTASGATVNAVQLIPATGGPPAPLLENQKYYLHIDAQYDSLLTAKVESFYFLISIGPSGRVLDVRALNARPKDRPQYE